MAQVQIIEPVKTLPKIRDNKSHRVCAYCRVSTDKYDQRNSLEAQEEFFASVFSYLLNHHDSCFRYLSILLLS